MITFNVVNNDSLPVYTVNVMDGDVELGFYLLIPHSNNIYEVHTHFNTIAYGSTVEISKQFLKSVIESNKDITTIVTKVPVDNKLAKRLANKCGFVSYGVLPSSFLSKDNVMIDQEMLYTTTEKILCLS